MNRIVPVALSVLIWQCCYYLAVMMVSAGAMSSAMASNPDNNGCLLAINLHIDTVVPAIPPPCFNEGRWAIDPVVRTTDRPLDSGSAEDEVENKGVYRLELARGTVDLSSLFDWEPPFIFVDVGETKLLVDERKQPMQPILFKSTGDIEFRLPDVPIESNCDPFSRQYWHGDKSLIHKWLPE